MASYSFGPLIGCWLLIDSPPDIDVDDRVEMKIEPSGRMIYGILEDQRWQVMILTYRVEGNVLISDQPSAPAEERTEFSFPEPDTLNLTYAGSVSSFRRIPECSFSLPEKKKGLLERLGFKK